MAQTPKKERRHRRISFTERILIVGFVAIVMSLIYGAYKDGHRSRTLGNNMLGDTNAPRPETMPDR